MKPESRFYEDFRDNDPGASGSDRNFGLVLAGVFAAEAAFDRFKGHNGWPWWLGAALAVLALALVAPQRLHRPNQAWTWLGRRLQRVMQPVMMAVVFVVLIVPTGLILRALGRDALRRRRRPSATSYWIDRPPTDLSLDGFKNPF